MGIHVFTASHSEIQLIKLQAYKKLQFLLPKKAFVVDMKSTRLVECGTETKEYKSVVPHRIKERRGKRSLKIKDEGVHMRVPFYLRFAYFTKTKNFLISDMWAEYIS